jgi:predicted Zn-dependent peptidase
LAHVLEHYLFRQQNGDESNYHLKSIEKYGGSINAFTELDKTYYIINVHKDDALQSIRILANILCDFRKNEDFLELEKQIITAEMNDVGEDSKYSIQYIKYEMLGAIESLKHVIGKKSSIKKITLDDLSDFYSKYYCTDNIVISIVGCFDKEEIKQEIEDSFYNLKNSSNIQKPQIREFSLKTGPRIKVLQNYINGFALLFIPCFSLTTDKMEALELLSDIFSDGTYSKVFEQLREKQGLIYSLSNNLNLSHQFGSLDIIISLRPNKLYKIISSLIEIAAIVRDESYSDGFLHQEKIRFIKKHFLMMENNSFAATWYAYRDLILDKNFSDDIQEWTNRVNSITKEDLECVKETLFNCKNWFLICVGQLSFIHKWILLKKIKRFLK